MNIHIIRAFLCIFFLFQSCKVESSIPTPTGGGQDDQSTHVVVKGISQEAAIAIANQDALKTYGSLADFNIVACEQTLFWRIIYDGGGPEYVIDKTSGLIRRTQKIPQELADRDGVENQAQAREEIDREEAIAIARSDVSESAPGVDMERFTVSACELAKVWRVFVEFKLYREVGHQSPIIPHASTPNYVIDKKTGKIIFKQR